MPPNVLSCLPYLFDRPTEPLFIGRDDVNFDVPTDYYPDRYKPFASSIQNRFPITGHVVPVKQIPELPDISECVTLGRHENFSLFNPYHRNCATKLIEVFMNMPNVDEFVSACVYSRERVNPDVFAYAASVAMLHRPDTIGISLPADVQIFPEMYMDRDVLAKAREEVAILPDDCRRPIEVPRNFTATDLDVEHRVAYFREDIGINLHHWHWHLVYPYDGPVEIVRKDRRGELFYYMHEQIQARYNMERLSNNLARVRRLNNLRDEIPEAYFPKLDCKNASRVWPARQQNSVLRDLRREDKDVIVDIQDLERWRDRIINAIHDGYVTDAATQQDIPLDEATGIDILGNIIEASILSVNRSRYGDFHNMGHLMLAYVHDPENRYLEDFSIMGNPKTTMRDPVFYAWHGYIDSIFQEYKNTLVPYTEEQLNFDGVRVTEAGITVENARPNEFLTFWQKSDVDLSRGLDFQSRGPVLARFTHLQHAPFTYRIMVENNGEERVGTVRIFIAPKLDERGAAYSFRDQRVLFVELDKFTVTLKNGINTIHRRSIQSSVTIPFEQTFRTIPNRPITSTTGGNFNYCGCGWPQHLLIAKGNAEGFRTELFVMVSDNRNDAVQQSGSNAGNAGCDGAQSYCGLRGGLYPDRRAMGFPFDRSPRVNVRTLAQFLTPNMRVQDTTIRFTDRTVVRTSGPYTGSQDTQPANQGSPESAEHHSVILLKK